MATTTKRKQTTTEKGLGWRHVQAREGLLRRHQDGALCDWDGRPMFKDPTKNWDYKPDVAGSGMLEADHGPKDDDGNRPKSRADAMRRGLPIPLPNRLLHKECNRQRGDGSNDHLAWINSGQPPVMDTVATATDRLVMPWPWSA